MNTPDGFTKAYFGFVHLRNRQLGCTKLNNVLIPNADSYEEAVGISYLAIVQRYPAAKGWEVREMVLDQEPVFRPVQEFEPGEVDMASGTEAAIEGETDRDHLVLPGVW